MKWSAKQNETILAGDGLERVILADGPWRAGKTVAMAAGFLLWAQEHFRGHQFLLMAKTSQQARLNMIPKLADAAADIGIPADHWDWSDYRKELKVGPRRGYNLYIFIDSATAGSRGKLRGVDAAGMWATEVSTLDELTYLEGVGRCSAEGSKLWLDTNPAINGKGHWSYRYIKEAERLKVKRFKYELGDNPGLPADYEATQRAAMSPIMAARFLDGSWEVDASTQVYPAADMRIEPRPPGEPEQWWLVVDAGFAGTTAASLFGVWPEAAWLCGEYRHSAREEGRLPDSAHAGFIRSMMPRDGVSTRVVVDPAAGGLKAELAGLGVVTADALNDVHQGIINCSIALSSGWLRFDPGGSDWTRRELELYRFDERSLAVGEAKPVKREDHHADVCRYFVSTYLAAGPSAAPEFFRV
ncbi:hypothetical protein F4X86_04245 [Candidatus Saccharibacteria bacterium]|nr:hypothetical protein [Candidatus Saccharibacteria bacterium]